MRLLIIIFFIGLIGCSNKTSSEDTIDTTDVKQEPIVTKVDKCAEFDVTGFLKTYEHFGTDGVFDTMYQRIQFHFESIKRSEANKCTYLISGFDRLKGLVTPFEGEIRIHRINKNKGNIYDRETPSEDRLVEFGAVYQFREDKNVRGSGTFSGNLYFNLTLNKDYELIDDMAEYMGDGFSNFIYEGTWTSYATGQSKKCIWGEGRLPSTTDFDVGAGERFVNDKYIKNGWELNKDWQLVDNPKEWWRM